MPRSGDERELAAAKAEHERSEARIEAIVNVLALKAPRSVRRKEDWEALLPRSRFPQSADPAGYLREAMDRGHEAAENLKKPFALYLIPFLGEARYQELKSRERVRVEALCRLLGGDSRSVAEAVEKAFAGISLPLPSGARFEGIDARSGRVEIDLPKDDVIPGERSSITKTGRISWKAWPDRERNEAYARLVASLGFLFAGSALDAAPSIEELIVSCRSPAIDPRTGADTTVCLLSFRAVREAFSRLRLDRIDPIAALSNFDSRIDIGKGAVLRPVTPIGEPSSKVPEEVLPEPSPKARRDARRSAAPPSAVQGSAVPLPPPPPGASEGEIAADALRLAVACARSDGRFEEPEIAAIEALIEERFSPTALEKKRLDLLREELRAGAIDVSRAAARLRGRLAPIERRLLVEGILSALLSKGKAEEAEIRLLETVAEKLDLPPHALRDMEVRVGTKIAESGNEKDRWLSALDLPADSSVTRELVERSARRIIDTYSEERFAAMGGDFQEMARRRREGAEEARRSLIRSLPPEPSPQAPVNGEEKAEAVRRQNPDLDAIFGA